MKEYVIVFDAIPIGLIRLIQGFVFHEKCQNFNFSILLNGVCIKDKKKSNNYIRKLCTEPAFPPAKAYWNSGFNNINWKMIWNQSRKDCVTNKVREVS